MGKVRSLGMGHQSLTSAIPLGLLRPSHPGDAGSSSLTVAAGGRWLQDGRAGAAQDSWVFPRVGDTQATSVERRARRRDKDRDTSKEMERQGRRLTMTGDDSDKQKETGAQRPE